MREVGLAKFLGLILIFLLVLIQPPKSALGADQPEAFLSEILLNDFNGDGVFRLGRVVYTKGMEPKQATCGCSEPQEVFDPRTDGIVIVSEWKLTGTERAQAGEVSIKVQYLVVATTEGDFSSKDKQREIVPASPPTYELITYRLRLQDDGWKLINPPLPRVGARSLALQYRSSIDDRRGAFDRLSKSGANLSGHGAVLKWETRQLEILENCCVR